jgi:hypothetical protein
LVRWGLWLFCFSGGDVDDRWLQHCYPLKSAFFTLRRRRRTDAEGIPGGNDVDDDQLSGFRFRFRFFIFYFSLARSFTV